LVALIALLSAQFGAGRMPVTDLDESRYAQASRQMLETGDYARIRLGDGDRTVKPIGVYWLQAASADAFAGERRNTIWAYRLPSALGLALAAMAALWGGAALIGQRPALLGAGLFAAGMLAGLEGMLAKTDALLAGFTTLAMAALAHLRMGRARPKLYALVFWAALACAVLIKGPVAPLVIGLTLGALALWERRARWMAPLLWWPGPLLAAAIAAPWFISINLATGGAFFAGMVGDIAPKMAHGDWLPGFYIFLLPFLIFPATYALPAAGRLAFSAARAPRDDDAHAPLRFLIAWAGAGFVFFELMPFKLPHYVLPMLPAIALLCAAGLSAMAGRDWRTTHPAGLAMFGVSGAVIVALTAASATLMPGDASADIRRAVSAALVGFGVLSLALAALASLRQPAARAGVLIACALVFSFSWRERLLPEARELHVSSEAAAALTRARLTPRADRPLWVAGYNEASLMFLTRSDIRMVSAAEAGAQAGEGQALIIEGRAMQAVRETLAARGLAFTPAEPPVRGFAIGRGERVALFTGRVSAAAADAPPQNP
ncbi:MAG TPA: glycosyltransferase family 39 protein, partial [Terricaulis sp.]|nr:glycosyltransferase family 39 protein [Terricaulis sp.]